MKMEGVRLHRVPRDWMARLLAGPLPDWCYELAWTPQALEAVPEGARIAEPVPESAAAEPGEWLLFDSTLGTGAELAERLLKKGRRTTVVLAGVGRESRQAEIAKFLARGGRTHAGVVYMADADSQSVPDFAAARECGWGGVLDVVQALTQNAADARRGPAENLASPVATNADCVASGVPTAWQPPRLWLVTCGAQSVGDRAQPVSLQQSPIWGLARVIAVEHPELNCTRIDLDPKDRAGAADQLAEEIQRNRHEDQVAYRDGNRLVARLRRLVRGGTGALETPRSQPYRLEILSRGELDSVTLRPVVRRTPGPGEVEIRVHATGLNFRDVLNLLNLYPGDPGPMGCECAGEVAAVGEGVTHVKPGDQVLALAPASFASYVLTLSQFVVLKPEHLDYREAATIPICFLTAHLALRRLGRMKPGERVLIHAASGGVGLAALQIARRLGLEVFATAGSPRKREFLESQGVNHVMDSRSLDFARQILEATGGEGIDLVVNSLTGQTIGESLSVLRAGGRFMELGKTDLWDQQRVDEVRPGVAFHAIALDGLMAEQPDLVGELLREVVAEFAEKSLEPLPLRTFRIPQIVEALRHMARAEHIGKVVIEAVAENDPGERRLALSAEATYLVTGGLGGLGLKLAQWLVDGGARNLVLLGRSAPSEEACHQLESLRKAVANVVVRRCDVGNRSEVAAVLAEIRGDLPPLRGIFHLAGALDDGVLREQTRERFDRVMASKATGGWALHDLTRDEPLDMFVLFSSAAALLGSPGQGNYAAANAFLERAGSRPPFRKAASFVRQLGLLGRGGHGGAAERGGRPALVRSRRRLDRAEAGFADVGATPRGRPSPGRRAADRLAQVLRADPAGK